MYHIPYRSENTVLNTLIDDSINRGDDIQSMCLQMFNPRKIPEDKTQCQLCAELMLDTIRLFGPDRPYSWNRFELSFIVDADETFLLTSESDDVTHALHIQYKRIDGSVGWLHKDFSEMESLAALSILFAGAEKRLNIQKEDVDE